MAKRELKPWHYQVTTALAMVTLFFVIAYFVQTFKTFFLSEHDPVLMAVERIKDKVEKR
jgi:succinate dehydrogenase hydrophobic anchor subunit